WRADLIAWRVVSSDEGETRDDTTSRSGASPQDEPAIAEPVLPEVAPSRYALGAEVGRGGIGRVREAHDTVLARTIAIKELHVTDAATRRRFVREAMITARLQHPSIVPIYEAGWRNGRPFYAMKLVAGRTLTDAIVRAATLADRLALLPSV